jgi:hypothetical protein
MLGRRADSNEVDTLLNRGRIVYPSDPDFSVAESLQRCGIIQLREIRFVLCSNKHDPDFDELEDGQIGCDGELVLTKAIQSEGRGSCPVCDRLIFIEGKTSLTKFETVVDYDRVLRYVLDLNDKVLNGLAETSDRGVWQGFFKGAKVRVCIIDFCDSDSYFSWPTLFSTPVLFIVVDSKRLDCRQLPDDMILISFGQLLTSMTPEKTLESELIDLIEVSEENKLEKPDYDEVSNRFDDFLTKLTPLEFELFINSFVKKLGEDKELLLRYKRKLRRTGSSILGALIRRIGGTGHEDVMVEPKCAYLDNLFKESNTLEMKRYSGTLELKDLRELIDFCEREGTDGVLFTSTSKVRSTVWATIRQIKNTERRWKYIVIDRQLLLELLCELKFLSMIATS